VLTVKQAAEYASLSESLIYAWCNDGTLPHIRAGRRGKRGTIRIDKDDLVLVLGSFKVSGQAAVPSASVQPSSGSLALPFSELNPKRLARAWKQG
jgi:excisionase family DNA binding protein